MPLQKTSAVLERICKTEQPRANYTLSALPRHRHRVDPPNKRTTSEYSTKDHGGQSGDSPAGTSAIPEKYFNELFLRPAPGLLAVRTIGAQGGAIYHSMTTLTGLSPDGTQAMADAAQQFDRVSNLADEARRSTSTA